MDQSGNKQLRTSKSPLGGTMRLGEYPFEPLKGSKLQKAYGLEKSILKDIDTDMRLIQNIKRL